VCFAACVVMCLRVQQFSLALLLTELTAANNFQRVGHGRMQRGQSSGQARAAGGGGGFLSDAAANAPAAAAGVGGARGVAMSPAGDGAAVVGGASACGSPTLVIGVLTKADAKGAGLRRVLRETWMRLADARRVTVRFILSVRPGTSPDADVASEATDHGDMLFLPVDPGHRRGYSDGDGQTSNLLERVQAFMRWTADSCGAYVVLHHCMCQLRSVHFVAHAHTDRQTDTHTHTQWFSLLCAPQPHDHRAKRKVSVRVED
jgi:hypothetical protein